MKVILQTEMNLTYIAFNSLRGTAGAEGEARLDVPGSELRKISFLPPPGQDDITKGNLLGRRKVLLRCL